MKTKLKHTPGLTVQEILTKSPYGDVIDYIIQPLNITCGMTKVSGKGDMSAKYNAYLFAAAPELLDMLEQVADELVKHHDTVDGPDGQPRANWAMNLEREIREAIAKAEESK